MATLIESVGRQAQQTFSKSFSDESFMECLSKLKRLVGQVKSSDVNLSREVLKASRDFGTRGRAPVTYIELIENQVFSMGIFVLKSGTKIPLHDHPGMFGVLKVIHGTLKISSYTPLPGAAGIPAPREIVRKIKSWQKSLLLPVQQHLELEVNDSAEPCVVSPTEGNLHEIRAVGGPAAFLDILAPPYDMNERDCHYYNNLGDTKHSSDVRIWLLRTSAPPDFWCESGQYYGPSINLS